MTLVREYQPTFVLGDGETKEFSYLFEEVSENFIKVIVKHSDDSTYVPVFSVDLDSHKVVFGESETAPLDTDLVCIYRETPDLQDTPFRTLQGYDAKALENILSKIVAMIQELKANGFSTQILQGTPWQLDLLHPADDGASVVIDYNARILKKGLYFQLVSGNLQVSADGNNFIKMPKSADITEFRCLETVLEDLTVVRTLQYKVNGVWYDAEANAQATADEALSLAQTVQGDLSSHKLNHNNPHETSLGNLTDTDFTNLQTNQFLKFNGTKWVNVYSSAIASWGDIIGNITDQTDLMNKFSEYVKTDGSSTMTGDLAFRYNTSYPVLRIIQSGQNTNHLRFINNNSASQSISFDLSQAAIHPLVTGRGHVGTSNIHFGDAHIDKIYTGFINNGYDISVPVTASADSFALGSEITDINGKIPAQASTSNQLADKSFVNSSIATNTANFIGTFNSVAELEAYSGTVTNNDYAFVIGTDSAGNTTYNRYKYTTATTPASWVYEYTLNNSSFTAAQWATINSGGTAADVALARSAVQPADVGNGTITITQGGETKGSFTTNQGGNTTIDIDASSGGSGLNVGDTFLTMRNDSELNGAVECDGSTYNTTDFTGAQSIGQLLADGKVPYVSMATYASTVAAQGWCDKFGWDGTGNVQFKVPTLSAYIWQKLQLGIKGSIGSGSGGTYFVATQSGFTQGTRPDVGGYSVSVTNDQTIPGASVDITSEDVSQQRCMVQLATSATDEALETCTSVLADVAALKYDYVVDFQAPTAQNNYTWYRKYKSGWVEQGGKTSTSGTQTLPVTMADTNYTVIRTNGNGRRATTANELYTSVGTRTTTTIYILLDANIAPVFWQVSGMSAS